MVEYQELVVPFTGNPEASLSPPVSLPRRFLPFHDTSTGRHRMKHGRTAPLLVLILATLTLPTVRTALAHDGVSRNPDPKVQAPVPVSPKLDLLTEGFESTSFPPAGWARIHLGNTYQWARTTATAHTGGACAWVQYGAQGTTQNEWLVTAALDLSAVSQVKLEFYEAADYWADYGDHHYVLVSTTSQTDPAAFTVVSDMTPANHTVNGFDGDPVTVDLSAYAGQSTVYVALRYTGSYADHWYVDDMRIFEPWLHDVSVVALSPDQVQFAGGATLAPVVTVANQGRSTEDFDVAVSIWRSGVPAYAETLTVTALAPGAQTPVTFPALTTENGNFYSLHAVALLPDDMATADNEGTAFDDTYTLPHVPLGLLMTNAGCSGCPQANQALDSYMPGQVDSVALLRIHVWWPGTDGIYNANTSQAQFLANGIGADYAPHLWIDKVVDAGYDGTGYAAALDARKLYRSPLNISEGWDPATETLVVNVENVEPMPADWILKLRVAVTEDNVYYAGSNGETIHNQAFRYLYPDTDGLPVPTAPGVYQFQVHCPVGSQNWDYTRLRAVAYVQDDDTWKVHNAVTGFLTDLAGTTVSSNELASPRLQLLGNHPNPFNPSTTIAYTLPASRHVTVGVYRVDGRLVASLVDGRQPAGLQTVVWNGRDADGRTVASGTYFYRVVAGNDSETGRMLLVK